MTSSYVEEASERAKTAKHPIRLVVDNGAELKRAIVQSQKAEAEAASNEAKILSAAQFHAAYLITHDRPGALLAFASRLEAEAKKFREAARTA